MCECGENQTQQNRKAKERRKKEFLFCGRQNFCVFCFIVPEMASKLSQITKIRRSKCSRNCDKVKRGKKCIGERKIFKTKNSPFEIRSEVAWMCMKSLSKVTQNSCKILFAISLQNSFKSPSNDAQSWPFEICSESPQSCPFEIRSEVYRKSPKSCSNLPKILFKFAWIFLFESRSNLGRNSIKIPTKF